MKTIIGLGNPGEKYKNTRHSVGFMLIDKLQGSLNLPNFKEEKKFKAKVSRNKDIILIKPQTFMNNSGESVSAYVNYFKINPKDLIVIHDDIDLLLGTAKISFGEGPAGHNGVSSVINALGSRNFWRVRIGILSKPKEKIETDEFVLGNFSKEELKKIKKITEEVLEALKQPIIKAEKFRIE